MNNRSRLLAILVLCLSVLAVGLLWWQAGRAQAQLRAQVLLEAERSAVHLADAMAGQVDGTIGLLDLALLYLRRELTQNPAEFGEAASNMLALVPPDLVSHVSVANATGQVVFSTLGSVDKPSVADQSFFLNLQMGGDRLVIDRPAHSTLVDRWFLKLARPLLVDGEFLGTVYVAVSTDTLARNLAGLALSPQDVVALIDQSGAFMARSLENRAAMGQVLPPGRPFLTDPALGSGSFHAPGQLDGTSRAYGWHRVGARGLVVSVGLADAGVLAPLESPIARGRLLTAVFSVAVLLGGVGLAVLLLRVARSEAKIAAAHALRLRLFDQSQVAMVVLDPVQFTFIECNDAAVRAYGFRDRQDTLGRNAMDVSAPTQRGGQSSVEAGQIWVQRAMREGLAVFEWLHQRPDGSQWDAEVHLIRFESEGRPLLQFTLLDVTARLRAEAALKASESRLKEAQRIALVGSWEQDLRTLEVTWTDEVFRLFEIDPVTHPASYATFIDVVHPDDRALVNRAYRASVEQRKPYDVVHRLLMPDGRVKHVREVGFTEFDGPHALRSVGTVQDITAVKEAEDALRRLNEELEDRVADRTRELSMLNRELESFAYSVSHDLRTPLRSINGYASLLAEDLQDRLDPMTRSHLERIRQAANRMGQLIDALLALSRVNRAELRPEWVDLSAVARSFAAELRAGDPQRVVDWHIDDGLLAWGDPELLQIVMENLLGNAWKYTRRTEQPAIRVERLPDRNGGPAFGVSDNGAGFDMQFVSQLFEPFKRLHAPSEFEGTGVGLATVQRVIERHGGWIEGEGGIGRGAQLRFGLPGPD